MAQARGTHASPDEIARRIVDAILAGSLAPGQRLGEQSLADLFGVSRTLVREALARLSARGMVEVNARRGWFVVQPSREQAEEAFRARVAIETGLLHAFDAPPPRAAIKRLKQHVSAERAAVRAGEPGPRSWLLGDFHVCLADCLGSPVLADILRDLTARTTLIATLFQSNHDAAQSCAEHAEIVAALEAGALPEARRLVRAHIESVARHLGARNAAPESINQLRRALEAPGTALAAAPGNAAARGLFTRLMSSPSPAPSPSPTTQRAAPRRRPEKTA
ncbi:MAG: GntR family transcriptional regulator [Ideonella sp.]|nr:GntR family transcriptional regulator [Ideonella sp.]MCC7459198.1 GntR family transcriptional regulator [Nitrospira sp.]